MREAREGENEGQGQLDVLMTKTQLVINAHLGQIFLLNEASACHIVNMRCSHTCIDTTAHGTREGNTGETEWGAWHPAYFLPSSQRDFHIQ
jgi:hypothetical protein